VRNWNITSFTGKENKLFDDAKRHSPDVVGFSSSKRRGSYNIELEDGWKFFNFGVEPVRFSQAGVGIIECLQLGSYNSSEQYLELVQETSVVLRRIETNESTIFLGDSNAHAEEDADSWKNVISQHGDADESNN